MFRIPVAAIVACLLAGTCLADASALRSAATDFLGSLTSSQRETAQYPLKDDARATWSNLPTIIQPPAGILIADLGDDQRRHVHRLLRASLSSQGYGKALGIMWLDDVLHETMVRGLEANPEARTPRAEAMLADRDSRNYAVAVFGNPTDNAWGWKITGHHYALNVTVQGERIAFTPAFLGSNPMVVETGRYAGWAALPFEGRYGYDLAAALDAEQRKLAVIADDIPADVFEGPGRRNSLKDYEGIKAEAFSADQIALLQRLVGEYLKNAEPGNASRHLDAIAAAGWKSLWFSWRGPIEADGPFYYRVHGPRLLIEYNRQDANHDHAVVRDPANDYGEDWLAHHYREFHRPLEALLEDLEKRYPDS
jgi:hypothetical protein